MRDRSFLAWVAWSAGVLLLAGSACGSSASDDVASDDAGDAPSQDGAPDAPTDHQQAPSALDWYPGYYGLTSSGSTSERDTFLTGSIAAPFVGVEVMYLWSQCEGAMGDYSAGFAAMDADLLAAEAAHKKLILQLQYKAFGGPGGGGDVVPTYLLTGPGAFCVDSGGAQVCGQYPMLNGTTAMIWNTAVAERLQAWFQAVGARYGSSGPGAAHGPTIAGIVLSESACVPSTLYSLASVGYTPDVYLAAMESNLLALSLAFPTKPVFQNINLLDDATDQAAALSSLATWALGHPYIGIGCPDVATVWNVAPAGYEVLENAAYQGVLPFNVAIQENDFLSTRTTGLEATFALATAPAPNGMGAQIVVWQYTTAPSSVFSLSDVATYLSAHPEPNVARPNY